MSATDPRHLGLVTCTREGMPPPEDRLLARALEERGQPVLHLAWDQEEHPWEDLDGLVIRSTWDYAPRHEEFRTWLESLEGLGVPVWNPPSLLRWNLDKRYLEDLEEAGVTIAPTGWIERGGLVHLHHILELEGWDEAVVKPVISAGAADTWAVDRVQAVARDQDFRKLVQGRDMMVQQLLPEIRREGELSFCFLGGEFSHAVRKTPASGDFRIQEEHGGSTRPFEPEAKWVEQAREILGHIPGEWLYARVDGVRQGDRLVLMELELLEPSMYLEHHPEAPARFAEALLARIRG